MSHVQSLEVLILEKHLDCLAAALSRFPGARMLWDKLTYAWYGYSVGDYPLPKGMTKDQLGKCSHVIHLDGCDYEIGVVKVDGGGYRLVYDFWGPGQALKDTFGDNLAKLLDEYQHQVAKKTMKNCTVDRIDSTEQAEKWNKKLGLIGKTAIKYTGKMLTVAVPKQTMMGLMGR